LAHFHQTTSGLGENFHNNCQTNYVPQAIPATPISLKKASETPLVTQASAPSFSQ
jgi:hypothetical protein